MIHYYVGVDLLKFTQTAMRESAAFSAYCVIGVKNLPALYLREVFTLGHLVIKINHKWTPQKKKKTLMVDLIISEKLWSSRRKRATTG